MFLSVYIYIYIHGIYGNIQQKNRFAPVRSISETSTHKLLPTPLFVASCFQVGSVTSDGEFGVPKFGSLQDGRCEVGFLNTPQNEHDIRKSPVFYIGDTFSFMGCLFFSWVFRIYRGGNRKSYPVFATG